MAPSQLSGVAGEIGRMNSDTAIGLGDISAVTSLVARAQVIVQRAITPAWLLSTVELPCVSHAVL